MAPSSVFASLYSLTHLRMIFEKPAHVCNSSDITFPSMRP